MGRKSKNPDLRDIRFMARFNKKEAQEIITKAAVYFRGDISKFIRSAALGWKPVKRTEVSE